MFYCFLICMISFASFNEKNQAVGASFQPAAPFSNNFAKASHFESIPEREPSKESQHELVQSKDAKISEDQPPSLCERCPICVGCQEPSNGGQKKLGVDKVKRELDDAATLSFKKIFAAEDEEAKGKNSDDVKEQCDEEENENANIIKNEEFLQRQEEAANATSSAKELLNEVENPKHNDTEQEEECEEDEYKPKKKNKNDDDESPHPKLAKNPKKGISGLLDDVLQTQFYKYSPDTRRRKKKSLLFNLHAKDSKNKKSIKAPKKVNYIALLGNDKSIVEVPALRLTVVPEDETKRRRRNAIFQPLLVTRYRKHSHRFKPKPPKHDDCCKHCPHFPILHANTAQGSKSDHNNDIYKRSSENYVRDADLLIQDVNNFLKFNLENLKKNVPVETRGSANENDITVFKKEAKEESASNLGENGKSSDSSENEEDGNMLKKEAKKESGSNCGQSGNKDDFENADVDYNSNVFKKEAREESTSNAGQDGNSVNSFENDDSNVFKKEAREESGSNLSQDEARVKQDSSMCGNEPGTMTNSLKSMEVAPDRDSRLGETDG